MRIHQPTPPPAFDASSLQLVILDELVEVLEASEATHLVMEDQGKQRRSIPMARFTADCRQRQRDLQRRLTERN